ncbi:sensor histidine kinase [Paenibacillus glucanolyticus]|jgi:two-component system OmpR family sensor kinase|uniref:sensor histidine kinase n=1 Tax=Paenibacillus TaxID=44249 RepID=UPI0003E246AA|nr:MULTISPECIES: HAMP domain-containing sensor histidine kinase [Paenibacillus]ANA79049.1 two-component sensor histidine kinase [Paenibacillus glucanolyticus]AVV57035.1 sensor histidine kinase [Paenibacillus glucanolyticus]ETT39433.1 integral membrane sensor signal transduction histidine kinase [Paenibacillus sp. FSL R5-808]MPY20601.1 HAMP domain-containing histidine kinase [Paenibacillus glucanolyticus]OMF78063.1 two-component sensor histidine kinase [Paenibacillus glucanolyticus]
MSIRLRLTAWYTGILFVTLLIFSSAVYGFVHLYTYEELKQRIVQQANKVDFGTDGFDVLPNRSSANRLEDADLYIQTYNVLNNRIWRSDNMKISGLQFETPSVQKVNKINNGFKRVTLNGNPFIVYQLAFTESNTNQLVLWLQVGANTRTIEQTLDRLQSILIMGSAATLVIASTLGLFLARKSMKPIGKVTEAAEQIQKGTDLSVRIEYDGPQDEIGQLIGTFNGMLERTEGFYKELEDAYAAQRRFVSDASHELRTPLTTIRGNVDLLQKMWEVAPGERADMDEATIKQISFEAVGDISDEAKRMSRLVNDMLSLARADTGQTFELDPVPLQPLVEEVARRAHFLEKTAEWHVGELSVLNGVYVEGNKDYLQQMLFIFIENAFKYTPEGEVSLDVVLYKGQVGLRISDTGIGMDKDEVPFIFERFYRADQSRGITSGTGLGLSIAKWIIDEHKGSVEVVTRRGEGSTFIVWLPVVFAPPLE